MKNPFKKTSVPAWTAALALAAMAGSAGANVVNHIDNSSYGTSPAAFNSGYTHYVDWSSSSSVAGHYNYETMPGLSGSDTKYLNYTSYAYTNSPSRCYIINTDNTTPAGANADTRIIVKNSSGVWVNLSDDNIFGGTYSWAQIYFYSGGNTRIDPKIRVTSYSSGYNNDAFILKSSFFTEDFGACLDGISSLPGTVGRASAYVSSNGVVTVNRSH